MDGAAILEADDLLITQRLYRRRARPASLESELAAHRELAAVMAADPQQAIQRFLELALELCPFATSAGLSELVEAPEGPAFFKWTAMSGSLAGFVGGTTPRNFSPCGLCLDQHHTILVERPGRVFTYFNDVEPPIIEGLVVPLYDTGKRPLGTLWVTSHEPNTRFDPTDARIMEQLAVQLVLAIKLRRKGRILAELEQTARDKDVLVQEVRHRVKNMIQMTSALLHLQEKGVTSGEAKTALKEAQSRLLVVANVYETLLQPNADAGRVDAAALITGLAKALCDTSADAATIVLRTSCDEVMLDVTDAVPLGLIVNEATTNAIKHAFAPGENGNVSIELKNEVADCLLTIRDSGKGFRGQPRTGSLGMRLMNSLARQLNGKLAIDGSAGTTVTLSWRVKAEHRPEQGFNRSKADVSC